MGQIRYFEMSGFKNGEFYYNREVADKHLTISGTTYKQAEVDVMMNKLK